MLNRDFDFDFANNDLDKNFDLTIYQFVQI